MQQEAPLGETAQEQWEKLKATVVCDLSRIQAERNELEKQKTEFQKMKEKISSVHFPTTIKLDVGGHQFKTSLTTLRKEDSMLSRMFSGSGFLVEKDEDGFYFIDRPGAYFAPILHYLQTGMFIPPTNPQKLKAIAQEVDFYQIQSLIDIVRPKYHSFKFVSVDDTSGVLYWLGTKRGTMTYQNPSELGEVTVVGSSNASNAVVAPGRPSGEAGWCNDARNKKFIIQLNHVSVVPSSYSLSYSGCCRPSNWTLEGCSRDDPESWELLKNHINDKSLTTDRRVNWTLPTQTKIFSQFRITCTGCDLASTGCFCFHVCEFEIYGDIPLN